MTVQNSSMHPILDPHQFLSGWIDSSSVFMPVRQQYPDLFARCDEIARSCPARMGGAANLDLLYALSEHLQALRVVETGVSYGWSSLALLLSLRKRAGARLISTDLPYPNEPEVERYTGCLVPQELHDQWTLLRMADRDGLPQVLGLFSEIDLCHYDSDKSYAGRMWAYPLLWEKLRTGGVFISDDIGDNAAFFDFCKSIQAEPAIIKTPRRNPEQYKLVGVIIKI